MRIAFIRVHKNPAKAAGPSAKDSAPKASSSSKGVILELERLEMASGSEEWRFGAANGSTGGLLPVRPFPNATALCGHIEAAGAPDVLWVEGSDMPPYLSEAFDACPSSLKVVYSKDWKPQKIEDLESYDLCLVDEDWQVEKVTRQGGRAAVWDKLIDYESTHHPLDIPKRYDICYVAYLRRRKQHELLFSSMAQIRDRRLSCVCIGGDPDVRLPELRALVEELGIDVTFAGDVPKDEVNRYVNESRVGVMCSREDGAPRALLEYMAADVPVLANAELLAGTRYVGPKAGLVRAPAEFATGITEMLDNLDSYAPRRHLLEHYSRQRVVETFLSILDEAARVAGKDVALPAPTAIARR
jgi:glycosyltransferase involved in cell wall biosynthesis